MSRLSPLKHPLRPLLLAVILALPMATAGAQTAPALQPAAPDPVVATVNGTTLHRSDIVEEQHEMGQQAQQRPLPQIYPALLDREVSITLFNQAGKAEKLQDDPEVKAMVARFEDRTITQVYLSRLVKAAVTDDALHAKFEQLMKDYKGQDEVHARHILLDKEADAKAVIAQLDKGADFAKLADQKSKEKNNNGGDLGWFTHDKMVPEFADAAFALKKGEYTKTPVKTQFGWHVIKLEDRRTAAAPTFEEKKAELSQQIEGQVIDKTLADLKAKAKITEFNLDGSPLPAGATAPVPAAPAGPPGPAPAKP